MNKNILAPGIIVYNVLESLGNNFVDIIENQVGNLFYSSSVVDGDNNDAAVINDFRTCQEYLLPENNDILNKINNATEDCLDDYLKYFQIEPVIGNPWILLKYYKNNKFDWHVDSGRRYPRNVSATLYINENYDGGLIEYKHFDLSYKPKSGDLVLFSSDFPYMHRVTPVTNGVRYAAVNWYRYSSRPLEYLNV